MDQKDHRKELERQRQHEKDLAVRNEGVELYKQSIVAAQLKPITYTKIKEQTRLKWFFFGKPFKCKTVVKKDKLSRTPREKTIAFIVTMIMATYCLITAWVGFFFLADVSIIPPNSKQAGIDLLLFKIQFGGNKPVEQAVLGTLLYMLSPLIFISSNWIIRKNPNK